MISSITHEKPLVAAARWLLIALSVVGDGLAGLVVLEGAAWGWLVHVFMVLAWGLGWHSTAPAAEPQPGAGAMGRVRSWAQGRSTWFWVSSALALCAVPGLVMPALLGASMITTLLAPRRLQPVVAGKRTPGGRAGQAPRARRNDDRRRVTVDSLQVRPLQDVVLRGDAVAKQRSALYLSTVLEQAPAPLLDVLLADPDLDVRSAAAVAVSRLELANSHALQDAGKAAIATPDDPEAYHHLAEAYRIYAFNAVTSDSQREFLLGRALAVLQDGLRRTPDDPALLLCAADTAWAAGDGASACDLLNSLLRQPAYPEAALDLLADIALNTHDYSLLQQMPERASSPTGSNHAG